MHQRNMIDTSMSIHPNKTSKEKAATSAGAAF